MATRASTGAGWLAVGCASAGGVSAAGVSGWLSWLGAVAVTDSLAGVTAGVLAAAPSSWLTFVRRPCLRGAAGALATVGVVAAGATIGCATVSGCRTGVVLVAEAGSSALARRPRLRGAAGAGDSVIGTAVGSVATTACSTVAAGMSCAVGSAVVGAGVSVVTLAFAFVRRPRLGGVSAVGLSAAAFTSAVLAGVAAATVVSVSSVVTVGALVAVVSLFLARRPRFLGAVAAVSAAACATGWASCALGCTTGANWSTGVGAVSAVAGVALALTRRVRDAVARTGVSTAVVTSGVGAGVAGSSTTVVGVWARRPRLRSLAGAGVDAVGVACSGAAVAAGVASAALVALVAGAAVGIVAFGRRPRLLGDEAGASSLAVTANGAVSACCVVASSARSGVADLRGLRLAGAGAAVLAVGAAGADDGVAGSTVGTERSARKDDALFFVDFFGVRALPVA